VAAFGSMPILSLPRLVGPSTSTVLFGASVFGVPDCGSPDCGSPDFGSPGFGAPGEVDVDAADDVLAAADELAPIGAASPATFSGELAQAVVRATPDTAARTRIVRRIIVNFLFLCRSHGAMRTPGIQFWTIDNGSVTAAVAAVPAGPLLGLNLKFSVRSPF
jgi:hypothetical protein